ncbi:MAG: glutamate racemase [Myxococcales bacterium]
MIGVYDSGFGGLTILQALRARLPAQDFVYLGDSGRAPYGGRDADTLLDFAEQCVERLFEEGCTLVVVACHTVSCVALRHLQRRYAPDANSARRVLGVTIPAAEAAVRVSERHIGVIGTERAIASGTLTTEIAKLGPQQVTLRAAPLLAPIVEEGWEQTDVARLAVARYTAGLGDIDTLLLACTHYPLLLPIFRQVMPPTVRLLDPAPAVALRLDDWLARHPGFVSAGQGRLRILCTGDPGLFRQHGQRLIGAPLPQPEHVAEYVDGRGRHLAHRDSMAPALLGQIVRDR